MLEELSLHILDIGMNSIAAGAKTLRIYVIENVLRDWLIIRVRDDGRGMDEKTLQEVLNQNGTSKKGRKKPIGLGLAFLRQTSEMCGGTFHVHSAPGSGTSVTASMRFSHIDRPPLGNLNDTILTLCANPDVEVHLYYRANEQTFHFCSKEGKHHESGRTQKIERQSPAASRAA
jgi:hypothetical protein